MQLTGNYLQVFNRHVVRCFSTEKNVWKASGRRLERRLEGSRKKVVSGNIREMVFFSFFGRKLEGSQEGGLEGSRKEDSS